nr:histidine phosphatase family protein [Actinomycetales bacterium]
IVGKVSGLVPVEVDDLREGDFGAWQGLNRREIQATWPDELERWHHEVEVAPPGGESLAQVAARVREVAGQALAGHAGETVVLVAHSIVTKTGIGTLTGMDPATWYELRIPPGSVSILRLWPEAHELVVTGLPPEVVGSDATPTLF